MTQARPRNHESEEQNVPGEGCAEGWVRDSGSVERLPLTSPPLCPRFTQLPSEIQGHGAFGRESPMKQMFVSPEASSLSPGISSLTKRLASHWGGRSFGFCTMLEMSPTVLQVSASSLLSHAHFSSSRPLPFEFNQPHSVAEENLGTEHICASFDEPD